jgi:hypothetical protein
MSEQRTTNGAWVVIALLAMGVIAGVAGLKFRQFPAGRGNPPVTGATTRAAR